MKTINSETGVEGGKIIDPNVMLGCFFNSIAILNTAEFRVQFQMNASEENRPKHRVYAGWIERDLHSLLRAIIADPCYIKK